MTNITLGEVIAMRSTPRDPMKGKRTFDQLEATALYCPRCRKAVPLRKRLLLVLPDGDKYEYLCAYCGTTVGDKTEKASGQGVIIVP